MPEIIIDPNTGLPVESQGTEGIVNAGDVSSLRLDPNTGLPIPQEPSATEQPLMTDKAVKAASYYRNAQLNQEVFGSTTPQSTNMTPEELGTYTVHGGAISDEARKEFRAQDQTGLELMGKGLANGIVEATLGAVEGAGYLLDFEQHKNLLKGTEKEFTNWFSEAVGKAKENLTQDVYRTQASEGFAPWTATWWADNAPSLASALSLMIPTYAAVKGMSYAGKAMGGKKVIEGLAKLTGTEFGLTQGRALEGIAGAFTSRYMENTMEALDTYQTTYQDVLSKTNDEKKAMDAAADAASSTWYANSANLVFDIPQYMMMFKGFNYAKGVANATKNMSFGKEVGLNMIGEGFEEGLQYGISKESQYNALQNAGLTEETKFSERLGNYLSDPEFWTATTLGAFGGAVFAAGGQGLQALQRKEEKKKQASIDTYLSAQRAALMGDKDAFIKASDEAFAMLAIDHADSGKLDDMEKTLSELQNTPEEFYAQEGFDTKEFKGLVGKRLQQLKSIEETTNAIYNQSNKSQTIKRHELGNRVGLMLSTERLNSARQAYQSELQNALDNNGLFGELAELKTLMVKANYAKYSGNTTEFEKYAKQGKELRDKIVKDNKNYPSLTSAEAVNKAIMTADDPTIDKNVKTAAEAEMDVDAFKNELERLQTPEGQKEIDAEEKRRIENAKKVTEQKAAAKQNEEQKATTSPTPETAPAKEKQSESQQEENKPTETEEDDDFDPGAALTPEAIKKVVAEKKEAPSTDLSSLGSEIKKEKERSPLGRNRFIRIQNQYDKVMQGGKTQLVPKPVGALKAMIERGMSYDEIKANSKIVAHQNNILPTNTPPAVPTKTVIKPKTNVNGQVNIELQITDPTTGETDSYFLPNNTIALSDDPAKTNLDFTKLTDAEIKDLFVSVDNGRELDEAEIAGIRDSYQRSLEIEAILLAEFKKSGAPVLEIPGGRFDFKLNWQFDRLVDQGVAETVAQNQLMKNENITVNSKYPYVKGKNVVVFLSQGTVIAEGLTQEQKAELADSAYVAGKDKVGAGYMALATLPDGTQAWFAVSPAVMPGDSFKQYGDALYAAREKVKAIKAKGWNTIEERAAAVEQAKQIVKDYIGDTFIALQGSKRNSYNVRVRVVDIPQQDILDIAIELQNTNPSLEDERLNIYLNTATYLKTDEKTGNISYDTASIFNQVNDLFASRKIDARVEGNSIRKSIEPNPEPNEDFFNSLELHHAPNLMTIQKAASDDIGFLTSVKPAYNERYSTSEPITELKDLIKQVAPTNEDKLAAAKRRKEQRKNKGKDNVASFAKGSGLVTLEERKAALSKILSLDNFDVKELNTLAEKTGLQGEPLALFNRSLMTLEFARNAARGVEYHEALHAVIRTFLTDEESSRLLREAAKEANYTEQELSARKRELVRKMPSYSELTDKELTDLVYEEYLADKYMAWRNNISTPGLTGFIKGLFNRFLRWAKNLAGKQTEIEKFFTTIDNGHYLKAPIVDNRYSYSGDVYQLIPGLDLTKTNHLLSHLKAYALDYALQNVDTKEFGYIDRAIADFAGLYNPLKYDHLEGTKQMQDIEDMYLALVEEADFIKMQLEAELEFDKNISKEQFDEEETYEELGARNFDLTFVNVDPQETAPQYFKRLLRTVQVEGIDPYTGATIRKVIDYNNVFVKLMVALQGKSDDKKIRILNELAKHDKDIAAVNAKFRLLAGLTSETNEADPASIQRRNAFLRATDVLAIDNIMVKEDLVGKDKTRKTSVFVSNRNNLEQYIFNNWENRFGAIRDPKILRQTPERMRLVRKIISLNNILNTSDVAKQKKLAKEIFAEFNITLPEAYLDFSFQQRTQEEQDALSEDFKGIFLLPNPLDSTGNTIFHMIQSDITKGLNPLSGESSRARFIELAKASMIFEENLYNPNYRGADGKPRYTFIKPNWFLMRMNEISQYNLTNIKRDLINHKYNKYNPLFVGKTSEEIQKITSGLKVALSGDYRLADEYETVAGDTFDKKKAGVTFKGTDPTTLLYTWAQLYDMGFKDSKTIANYVIPAIIAEKKTSFATAVPVVTLDLVDANGNITDFAANWYYNSLFKQEVERMKGAYGESFKNKNARKEFLNLPYLNENKELMSLIEKVKSVNELDTNRDTILAAIKTALKQEVAGVSDMLRDFNISEKTLFPTVDEVVAKKMFGNFAISNLIQSAGIMQLVRGDVANSSSAEMLVKRNALLNAFGDSIGEGESKFAFIPDTKKYLSKTSKETISKEQYDALSDKADYIESPITTNDGQGYGSIESYINTFGGLARLNQDQISLLRKLNNPDIVAGQPVYPSLEELNKLDISLMSSKLVIAGLNKEGKEIYQKMSVAWLTRELTSDYVDGKWVAKPHRKTLHDKLEFMEKNALQFVFPESASKSFIGTLVKNEELSNPDFVPTKEQITSVHNKLIRLQVENDPGGDRTKLATQLMANIDHELSPAAQEEAKTYRDKIAKVRELDFKIANKMLSYTDAGDLDMTRYAKRAYANAVRSGVDESTLRALALDGRQLKLDPNISHLKLKHHQYFLSHYVSGAMSTELEGSKATLISPDGFEVAIDENGNTVSDAELKTLNGRKAAGSRALKAVTLSKDGQTLEVAEVMMTRKQAAKLGLNVGDIASLNPEALEMLSTRIPHQDKASMLVFKVVDFLPDSYRDSIVIPEAFIHLSGTDFDLDGLFIYRRGLYTTEDGRTVMFSSNPNSFEEYRAGWLKNKIIAGEIVDKVKETKALNRKVDRNAIIKNVFNYYGLATTVEEFNALADKSNPETARKELIDQMIKIAKLPEMMQYYYDPVNTAKATMDIERLGLEKPISKYSPYGLAGKLKAYISMKVGADITGIAANQTTTNAVQTKHNIQLKTPLQVNGKQYGSYGKTLEDDYDVTTNQLKENASRKASTLSTFITEGVDNLKELLAEMFNHYPDVIGKVAELAKLGVGHTTANLLALHPVIVNYTKFNLNSQSAVVDSAKQEIDGLIKSKLSELLKEEKKTNPDITLSELEDSIPVEFNAQQAYQAIKIARGEAEEIKLDDKLRNEIAVLKFYKKIESLEMYSRYLAQILQINKGNKTNFDDFDSVMYAIEALDLHPTKRLSKSKLEQLPFDTAPLRNDVTIMNNINSILAIEQDSGKMFLRKAPVFKKLIRDFENSVNTIDASTKQGRSLYKNLETRIVMSIMNKMRADNGYAPLSNYHDLLYDVNNNNTLLKKIAEVRDKNPDLQNNYALNMLRTKKGNQTTSGIDSVKVDTFTKFTPELTARMIDSLAELEQHPNEQVNELLRDMFRYIIVKDNGEFVNGSYSKFMPLNFWTNLSKRLTAFMKESAAAKDAVEQKSVLTKFTGMDYRTFKNSFLSLYLRSKKTSSNVKRGELKALVDSGVYSTLDGTASSLLSGTVPISTRITETLKKMNPLSQAVYVKTKPILSKEDLDNKAYGKTKWFADSFIEQNTNLISGMVPTEYFKEGKIMYELVDFQKVDAGVQGFTYHFLYKPVSKFDLRQYYMHLTNAEEAVKLEEIRNKTAAKKNSDDESAAEFSQSGEAADDIEPTMTEIQDLKNVLTSYPPISSEPSQSSIVKGTANLDKIMAALSKENLDEGQKTVEKKTTKKCD